MSKQPKVEPAFGAAPAGRIMGNLKGKPRGFHGLSKRVKIFISVGVLVIIMGILVSVMHIPSPEDRQQRIREQKEQEDQQKRENGGESSSGDIATTPKPVKDVVGGVSAPAPVPPVSASAPVPGSGVPTAAAGDKLAPAGGAVPNIPGGASGAAGALAPNYGGAGGDRAAPVDRAAVDRENELKQARESDLTEKAGNSMAGLPSAATTAAGMLPTPGAATTSAAPVPGGGNSGGDDQNKQLEKNAFLLAASSQQNATYLSASVQAARSPYQVDMGWEIHCMMDQVTNSDLPGTLRAHVAENVMDSATGRFVLIPSGSRLVGHYDSQIAFGQSRVLVVWDTIIFPDSSQLQISGMQGTDQQGAAGLPGDVDNHLWPMLRAAVFMSVITAGAQLSQPQSQNSSGGYSSPTVSQQLAAQMGQQLGQVSSSIINRYLNIQPTITAKHGTRFNILVTKNMTFAHPWSWD
ncbi:TrbI/VirB10 family protein [Burkholderia sp. LMG 13014]|uniref:TrbI/VirB10 family protein n=1 Tax=Burkholderia sp. LMG 13014 TaxID=2709306 RepID=UPI0019648EB3|nr:TrbI/VirB10 family protein [Burkholderia sp. LMG 13014]